MKIVSFNEISRDIKSLDSLFNSGIYNLFGRGTMNLTIGPNTIPPGGSLASYLQTASAPNAYSLEFKNLTIEQGADVLVNNLGTVNENQCDDQVAYLKVNGTLIVNGHLHMDRQGGTFAYSRGTPSTDASGFTTYKYNDAKGMLSYTGLSEAQPGQSCSDVLWGALKTYGTSNNFFDGRVCFTGSGSSGYTKYLIDYQVWEEDEPKVNPYNPTEPGGHIDTSRPIWGQWQRQNWRSSDYTWVWYRNGYQQYLNAVEANSSYHTYYQYETRGSISTSYLSGSCTYSQVPEPTADGAICAGGAGGGFLAIYSEDLKNSGNIFIEGENEYPLNIHANGGTDYVVDTTPENAPRGGGCLIIAARRIIIGPQGSITADGGNGRGLMTLMNRSPYTGLMLYNTGTPSVYTNTLSGGAGFAQFFPR